MKKLGLYGIIVGLALVGGQALPQTGEIKVALVLPFSGPLGWGDLATDLKQGLELGLAEVNFQAGGRKIALVALEDSQGTPEGVLARAKKVVEQDGVEVVVGPLSAPEGLAMRDYLVEKKRFFLMTYAGLTSLTAGEKCGPYLFSTTQNTYILSYPLGEWVATQVGKTAYVVGMDLSGVVEAASFFEEGFKKAGGQVLARKFVPLSPSPQDFTPLLNEIAQAKPAVVFMGSFGGINTPNFVKQFHQAGLDKSIRLVGNDPAAGSIAALNSMGDSPVGILTSNFWMPTLQNDVSANFLKAYRARYKAEPSGPAMIGYDAARILVQTLEATKGNSDVELMRRALEKLTIPSPRGSIRFDENHMVVQPMYIFEVQKVDGKLTYVTRADLGPQASRDFGCKGTASR